MDLEKTIVTLKKELEFFGLNHKCSKLELYRKYQKYLKYWKLDNFETIDEKLSASKKIEKAHKAYDFIKANWNFLVLLKKKEESYDRYIIIIVFVFLFFSMMTYMQNTANKRVRKARIEAVGDHESSWAWTHGVSDTLVKISKQNALDDFWGKVIKDTTDIKDFLTFWPHTLNRHEQNKIRTEIMNGSAKHTVFPNEEYQRKGTIYITNRLLSIQDDKTPKITFEKIIFFRNHYEMTFNYSFDESYKNQKILNVDFGPINIIEPKYYKYTDRPDSIWTKSPSYPIMLDNFLENCVSCGGGIILPEYSETKSSICVFRFNISLPYETRLVYFKGVGSPINDIPLNIKPYINKLKKEWFEKLPYRPLDWKNWRPMVLKE